MSEDIKKLAEGDQTATGEVSAEDLEQVAGGEKPVAKPVVRSGDTFPTEQVSLSFGKIELKY